MGQMLKAILACLNALVKADPNATSKLSKKNSDLIDKLLK